MLRTYFGVWPTQYQNFKLTVAFFAFFSQDDTSTPLLLSLGNHKLLRYGGLQWRKMCLNEGSHKQEETDRFLIS